jgi:integration host factor subunit beta
MLKSELIEKIAVQNPHLYRQDAEKIVNTILDTITAALAQGDRVELRGFGVFTAKTREPRTGRNPRDGAQIAVPQKVTPAFKTSRDMHRRLNLPASIVEMPASRISFTSRSCRVLLARSTHAEADANLARALSGSIGHGSLPGHE